MELDHVYSPEKEREALFNDIRLGLDVRQFIESHPVGKLLMERASQEITDARTALENTDSMGLAGLQFKAATARNVISWLGEAIQAGDAAENQLEQQEEADHE